MQNRFHIRPRYARLATDEGIPLAERNYQRAHLDWRVPANQCALVCIDCWSWHFSEETFSRIDDISRNRIAPLLEACRKTEMTIVHAPANPVASRHPNLVQFRADGEVSSPPWPDSPSWPPQEFRSKTAEFAEFAKPSEPSMVERARHGSTLRDFHESCRPQGNEPVVIDGEDLHRLCAERGILHLFFLGFNTNACVMMRDYGLPAMVRRGYHGILVRDCTTGMEIADTVETLACTHGTIADIEQFLGYTVTSDELIAGIQEIRS
ncbi:MAG: isochorismatase family protein [Lentisphaeria bacterium]|nr:isochorismatase family protein [Lentisphaeria bacterium]